MLPQSHPSGGPGEELSLVLPGSRNSRSSSAYDIRPAISMYLHNGIHVSASQMPPLSPIKVLVIRLRGPSKSRMILFQDSELAYIYKDLISE